MSSFLNYCYYWSTSEEQSILNIMKRYFYILLSFLLGLGFYGLDSHFLWTHQGQQSIVLSILICAMTLWITEVIPLFVTAIMSSFFLIIFTNFTPRAIFAPYFDPVIILFLGGFLLARAIQKHQMDFISAQYILSKVSNKPSYFLLALMFFTAFLSLWVSNTASAAIMIPLAIIILKENNLIQIHVKSRFATTMILGVAYAATIGGVGSLVGSPPNAIAVSYLEKQGIALSFLDWMIKTIPFLVLALIFIWQTLLWINPPEIKKIAFSKKYIAINKNHKLTLLIFLITVVGWLTTSLSGLSSSTVALVPIILLFIFQVLDEADLSKISWSTILLFGGGLSLGNALTQAGIGEWIVIWVQQYLVNTPQFITIFGFVISSILLTMTVSNTAAAAILIPLILPLAKPLGFSPTLAATLIAVGVSLDFMIPIGTPPSAIAHSTGLVKVSEMVKNGVLINIGTALILSTLFYFVYAF
ncbi:MAG: SLC13/DASS family transporter [Bdellovibrionaceae bacterium]|jgi:solute carrier family 13 (sodium-dependent dicarboxylate transporter), member 2/3/5|nr:SLC13/DASS family transporter [Pseudobdellovibrionaceae bacterium]